jgi:hypothetical protein
VKSPERVRVEFKRLWQPFTSSIRADLGLFYVPDHDSEYHHFLQLIPDLFEANQTEEDDDVR